MAAPKFLAWVSGKQKVITALVTSAGMGDADRVVATGANGKLHSSLMADGIVPDQKTAPANGAISARDLCYVETAGTIARASAAAGGNEAKGFALAAAGDEEDVTIQYEGIISGFSSLTPGADYYLSDSTPGGILIAPGPVDGADKLGQFVGSAMSATELNFEPDRAVVLG